MTDDVFDVDAPVEGDAIDPATEGAEPPSIDDTLRDTLAQIQERDASPDPKFERPRAPDGKFAKVDKAPEAEAAPVEQTATPAPSAAATFADKGPPETWRAGAKAIWAGLPEGAKAEIYKREQDMFTGLAQYQGKAQIADTLMQTIQPYQPIMAALGTNIPAALNEVLRTAAIFHVGTPAQKAATLRQLAQTHGVEVSALAGDTGQADTFRDPTVERLDSRLAQLEGVLANQHRQAQYSDYQQAAGQITAFRNDPSNKYFADVAQSMGRLINAGLAESLQDAYAKACELNPQVKAALAAEKAADDARKATDERARRAKDARRAGQLGVRSTPAPGTLSTPSKGWQDSLGEYYKEIVGA